MSSSRHHDVICICIADDGVKVLEMLLYHRVIVFICVCGVLGNLLNLIYCDVIMMSSTRHLSVCIADDGVKALETLLYHRVIIFICMCGVLGNLLNLIYCDVIMTSS